MEAKFYRYRGFVTIYACWLFHFLITLTAISQSKANTWFEAQKECREKNQSLTLWKNESTSFYWTGFYNKTSQWIKIIGCYKSSEIQNGNYHKYFELSISSPPLCQEHCLQEDIYLFAVRARRCICLSNGFNSSINQLVSSNCTYKCTSGGLLSRECGGESAFNVFRTGTTDLNVYSRCLSLQCGNDPRFLNFTCNGPIPTICSTLDVDSTSDTWRNKKEYCKKSGNYPFGNITLSNITKACNEVKHNEANPRWVGVVKELYQKQDQGQLISNSEQISITHCMKCRYDYMTNVPDCQYERCNRNLTTEVYCSKKEASTTLLPENTDTSFSDTTTRMSSHSVSETTSIFSIELEITGSIVSETTSIVSIDLENTGIKEESSVIIVPVIIVSLVLFVCAVAIILYIRRKKQRKEKDTNGGKKSPKVESINHSIVENHGDNNYFVLQKSNPSYELAGECIIGCESPYNEAEDGTYDHLGHRDARKTPAEDIYNHTSGAELSDLSDYDVTNHKRLNEENNTYDHAGVMDNSYGSFDLSKIKETDYSEFS